MTTKTDKAEQQAADEKAAVEQAKAEQQAADEKAAVEQAKAEQQAADEKAAVEQAKAEQQAADEKAELHAREAAARTNPILPTPVQASGREPLSSDEAARFDGVKRAIKTLLARTAGAPELREPVHDVWNALRNALGEDKPQQQ